MIKLLLGTSQRLKSISLVQETFVHSTCSINKKEKMMNDDENKMKEINFHALIKGWTTYVQKPL